MAQALEPTDFGAFDDNGIWQAKDAFTGTFGTNGYHLFDFANESGIGNDSSGNDNDFTVNNISDVSLTTHTAKREDTCFQPNIGYKHALMIQRTFLIDINTSNVKALTEPAFTT